MSMYWAPLNTWEYTTYAMMAWYSRDKSSLRSSARRSREISSGAADCDSGPGFMGQRAGLLVCAARRSLVLRSGGWRRGHEEAEAEHDTQRTKQEAFHRMCSPFLHSRLLSLRLNGSLPLGWGATPASSPSH